MRAPYGPPIRRKSRRPRRMLIRLPIAGVLLAVIAVGGWWWFTRPQAANGTTTTPPTDNGAAHAGEPAADASDEYVRVPDDEQLIKPAEGPLSGNPTPPADAVVAMGDDPTADPPPTPDVHTDNATIESLRKQYAARQRRTA